MRIVLTIILITAFGLGATPPAHSAEAKKKTPSFSGASRQPASAQTPKPSPSGRSKKLDFDDSTVEGINKQPLDSLAQIADADGKRKKRHLYQKRMNFNPENQIMVREMGMQQ